MDHLDHVQMFIPAPVLSNVNASKVVESLANDKQKTVTILAEALESSLDWMKSCETELLAGEMKPEQVQAVQMLVVEDIIFKEHNIDFEDFKQTVMAHRLLEDLMIGGQIRDGFQQVKEYYQDKFPDDE